MRSLQCDSRNTHQAEFMKIFRSLCGRYGRWDIWHDFITLAAIEISNAVDRSHAAERGETYKPIAEKYKPDELRRFALMFQEVIAGMEQNADQDFFGELYMALELGNKHIGQCFTPYDACRLMAELTMLDIQTRITQDGWVSVNDSACGSGAILTAFANACLRHGVNYQTSVFFVAQDVSFIAGLMCYLQLSLIGCAGYVVIGDTFLHPVTALDRRGLIPQPDMDILFTPFYFRDIWQGRRICAKMDLLLQLGSKSVSNANTAAPTLFLQEAKA